MGLTKQLFQEFQEKLINDFQAVEEGKCPLELYISLKEEERYYKEYNESVKAWIKENAEEISQLAKENPDGLLGYDFQVRNGSSTWDFKGIQEYDEAMEVINGNKAFLKDIESKYKDAYNQSLQGRSIVDESTGVALPLPSKKQVHPITILKKKNYLMI